MNFVIPMAGRGQRFADVGYTCPKYFIEAKGKTLLEWSLSSLPLELASKLIFIALREHEAEFDISSKIKTLYSDKVNNIEFLFLDQVTRGQAETVYLAKNLIIPDTELLIFNIDTSFHSSTLKTHLSHSTSDGIIGCFKSDKPQFSFASVDDSGFVIKTAEKVVISENALTGLYHFKQASDFIETVEYHLNNNIRYKGEFYIAPMYNFLIEKGRKFTIDMVDQFSILGTPEELQIFLKS